MQFPLTLHLHWNIWNIASHITYRLALRIHDLKERSAKVGDLGVYAT